MPGISRGRFHILVVDDDREMTDMLDAVLSDAGYRVTSADQGEDALRQVRREPPDLMITDLSMPGMGGLELIEAVHRLYPHLPSIILTAFGDWPSFCRAQDLCVKRYLSKPIAMDDLLRGIGDLLNPQNQSKPSKGRIQSC